MKIYTEVNYKWLDGQLVKTDSKSFEYEGEITLCSFGGGGGGDVTEAIDTAIESASNTVDIVGQNVSDVGEIAQESGGLTDAITTGMGTAGENLRAGSETLTGNLNEGLSTGTESLGMNEGVSTTLGDFGENINTNMAPIVAEADRWGTAALEEVNRWTDYLGEKGEEVGTFIHGSTTPSSVTLDPDQFAIKGSKKKKNRSDLAVNKAKTRGRKSLRIG